MKQNVSARNLFIMLISFALVSGLVAGQKRNTLKASGKIASLDIELGIPTGFVLSQVGANNESTKSSFSFDTDNVVCMQEGDNWTLIFPGGKKITVRIGDNVEVQYQMEGSEKLVTSLRTAKLKAPNKP